MADMPGEVTVGVMPPAEAAGVTLPAHRVAVTPRVDTVAGRYRPQRVRPRTPALRPTRIIAVTGMAMEITTEGGRGRPDPQ